MGSDFSSVRVHDNFQAHNAAKALRARAMTYQNHIFFNKGELRTQDTSGRTLLAHELWHTRQSSSPQLRLARLGSVGMTITPEVAGILAKWNKSQADVDADTTLNKQLDKMVARAPAAQGSRQPPEAEAAFSAARAVAQAAVTPGLQFQWEGKNLEVVSLRITSQLKVRDIKTMVENYFGPHGKFILGHLKREMKADKVGEDCEAIADTNTDAGATSNSCHRVGIRYKTPVWSRNF